MIGFHQSLLTEKWKLLLPSLKNKEIEPIITKQRVNLGAASVGFIISRIIELHGPDYNGRIALLEIGLGMVTIVTLLEK